MATYSFPYRILGWTGDWTSEFDCALNDDDAAELRLLAWENYAWEFYEAVDGKELYDRIFPKAIDSIVEEVRDYPSTIDEWGEVGIDVDITAQSTDAQIRDFLDKQSVDVMFPRELKR